MLIKQLRCRWFEAPYRSCYVIVMFCVMKGLFYWICDEMLFDYFQSRWDSIKKASEDFSQFYEELWELVVVPSEKFVRLAVYWWNLILRYQVFSAVLVDIRIWINFSLNIYFAALFRIYAVPERIFSSSCLWSYSNYIILKVVSKNTMGNKPTLV